MIEKMAEISQIVEQFKQLDGRVIDINKSVKDLKEKMGYKQVSEQLKQYKEYLYSHMVDNNLKELNGIKMAKVKPSSVKTEERGIRIATKIENVLEEQLDESIVSELTPLLLEAVISR